jgi:hypothetical protein
MATSMPLPPGGGEGGEGPCLWRRATKTRTKP